MIINKHTLVRPGDTGNGYHGYCQHCGAPLITDLGFTSWEGLKCVDRKVELYLDIPKEIREYADFRGFRWDNEKKLFTKPYSNEEYTLDSINERLEILKEKI